MAIGAATTAEVGKSDPIITRLAGEDTVPWWRKPNLRFLYLMLFPTCMGIELTSGFDSQMINALQIVPSWKTCKLEWERVRECASADDKPSGNTRPSRLRQPGGLAQGHHRGSLLARRHPVAPAHPHRQ